MKKILLTSLVFLLALGLGSQAMAAANNNEGDAGTAITVTDGLDPENTLTFNFSPSVNGQYATDDGHAAGNKQWFSIATYHGGGTKFYATSSDQTIVWKKDRDTTQTFTNAVVPVTEANLDADTGLPLGWDEMAGTPPWTK